MSNYLIKQNNTYSVKVPIPADLQHVFDKRAFKKTLKTSDKIEAIKRSGPLIEQYKRMIEEARADPTRSLEEYLEAVRVELEEARSAEQFDEDSVQSIQDEILSRLTKSFGKRYPEELDEEQEAQAIKAFKIADGQLTPFDKPLNDYVASRKVEKKTIAKDRHAVSKFAEQVAAIQLVDKASVRAFVKKLSQDEGVKNRTIKDNLSTLRNYWKWLQDNSLADEDKPNPFNDVRLPAENRKDAAEDVRLAYSVEQVRALDEAIQRSGDEMLYAAYQIAVYTGCRLEEIARIEVENVTEDAIKIVRAKTRAGNRTIPIHDHLKPLVKRLVAEGKRYLLPDLKENSIGVRSSQLSKRFGRLKTKLGFDRRYVFHCLRNTGSTQLEQAGVPEGVTADILGHNKPYMSYGVYSGGSSFEQKREAIMKLDYGL